MNITPIRTDKILPFTRDISSVLDISLSSFSEKCILAISSKIVAICEGRVIKKKGTSKRNLVYQEADFVLSPQKNKDFISLTITHNLLIPTAGIDESNGRGYYVLLPKDPQKSANFIRQYLCERFKIQYAGVIITDSIPTPLRLGTTGIAIVHSGFEALRNYTGKSDLFGRKFKITKANVMNALAASAVVVMGEGKEQTPIAIIRDIPFIHFQKKNPTKKELDHLNISIKDDLYAPFLKNVSWDRGYRKKSSVRK